MAVLELWVSLLLLLLHSRHQSFDRRQDYQHCKSPVTHTLGTPTPRRLHFRPNPVVGGPAGDQWPSAVVALLTSLCHHRLVLETVQARPYAHLFQRLSVLISNGDTAGVADNEVSFCLDDGLVDRRWGRGVVFKAFSLPMPGIPFSYGSYANSCIVLQLIKQFPNCSPCIMGETSQCLEDYLYVQYVEQFVFSFSHCGPMKSITAVYIVLLRVPASNSLVPLSVWKHGSEKQTLWQFSMHH